MFKLPCSSQSIQHRWVRFFRNSKPQDLGPFRINQNMYVQCRTWIFNMVWKPESSVRALDMIHGHIVEPIIVCVNFNQMIVHLVEFATPISFDPLVLEDFHLSNPLVLEDFHLSDGSWGVSSFRSSIFKSNASKTQNATFVLQTHPPTWYNFELHSKILIMAWSPNAFRSQQRKSENSAVFEIWWQWHPSRPLKANFSSEATKHLLWVYY